jgi:GNAT superfamily N-acetyltransferase
MGGYDTPMNDLTFRTAVRDDVPEIVRMLADDRLGATREAYTAPLPDTYYAAFDAIARDPNNELIVCEVDGRVVGTLQLTVIPYITHRGSWRALVDGVRVDSAMRSGGIGRRLMAWAIDRATQRGCGMIQLTSNKTRTDAIRFYQSLGFVASHEGLKLDLPRATTPAAG